MKTSLLLCRESSLFKGILLFISFHFISSCRQPNAQELVENAVSKIKNEQDVRYFGSLRMKYFSGDDTISRSGTVYLRRVAEDSIFGGNIRIESSDTIHKIADGHFVWEVNNTKKAITQYDLAKGEEWALSSEITSRLVWSCFLDPKSLLSIVQPPNIVSEVRDTAIEDNKYKVIDIEMPDNGAFEKRQTMLFFDKDFLPVMSIATVRFQGAYQYVEQKFARVEFGQVNNNMFSVAREIAQGYSSTTFKQKTPEEMSIQVGAMAPSLIGVDYTSLKEKKFTCEGKLTLLDFWYTSCHPCIQAIPQVEMLLQRFSSDKLQIIGMNSVDNDSKGLIRIQSFLEHNRFTYPILLVDDSIVSKFAITVWPTFIIVDSRGQVAERFFGFCDHLADTLEYKLNSVLNRK